MAKIATTPDPPYFAVIAPAELSADTRGYGDTAAQLLELARDQPGFLGIETCVTGDFVMAVSYWESLEAIEAWRGHARHQLAKDGARRGWFSRYRTRIARVEAEY